MEEASSMSEDSSESPRDSNIVLADDNADVACPEERLDSPRSSGAQELVLESDDDESSSIRRLERFERLEFDR